MTIHVSRITYARLINTGNYSNERLEAEVMLTANDDPGEKAQSLALFVEEQLNAIRKSREEAYRVRQEEDLAEYKRLQAQTAPDPNDIPF